MNFIATPRGVAAVTMVYFDVAELQDNGVNGNPLVIQICEQGRLDIVKHLVETLGMSFAAREYFNAAVKNGHLDLTKYLHEKHGHAMRHKTLTMAQQSGNPELEAFVRSHMVH